MTLVIMTTKVVTTNGRSELLTRFSRQGKAVQVYNRLMSRADCFKTGSLISRLVIGLSLDVNMGSLRSSTKPTKNGIQIE